MMNCGAILSRNVRPPFQRRAIDFARKGEYSHTPIFPNLERNIEVIQIRNVSIPIQSKVHRRLLQVLSLRKFHKGSLTSCSKSEEKQKPKINLEDIINDKETENVGIFENPHQNFNEKLRTEEWSQPEHINNKDRYSIRDIERMYTNPKGKLNDIFQIVSHELQNKDVLNMKFTTTNTKKKGWCCTLKIQWPEEMTFVGIGSNKINSGHGAASKCLLYLENNRRLSPTKKPIIYSSTDIKEILDRPVRLAVDVHGLSAAKKVIDRYDNEIKMIMEEFDRKNLKTSASQTQIGDLPDESQRSHFQPGAIIDPVGKSNPFNRTEERLADRNKTLKLRYENRIATQQNSREDHHTELPIDEFRNQIITEIENNQVLVIKGDTGCGKTTQVPQYIMDSFAAQGNATNCNIIVSQPRRISAISLAERIADERKEQVGDVVGYQVRLSQELPNTPAGILFCTSGILLRKLQFNPNLEGCSHVIIDEAHERTINTDMLLALLKRAVENNKNLKVIIMSATINAELFQEFFKCGVIQVPGRTFPVTMNFMEDIDKLGLRSQSKYDMSFDETPKAPDEIAGPSIDVGRIGELISWITFNKPPGAILCFLPGWSEITKVKKYIEEYGLRRKIRDIIVVPVHSKMSHQDQRKIFQTPPPNIRKIVLATDIAETGITVTDVSYVVDSCTHRQVRWHEKRGLSSIDSQWASQANIMQRKGRAGRVKPGTSYHFITREMFEQLEQFPTPEVKRSSLEKTVLDAKTYSSEKALEFLSSMPEPPAPTVIKQAVQNLIELGALDMVENLTPLGKRIALFTVDPKLSKAMLYSSIFHCVAPMVTIASVMSSDSDIFIGQLNNKEGIRNVKQSYHPTSDHNSVGWLFQEWNSHNKSGRFESRDFCLKSRLYPERMFTLSKVRELNADHLVHAKMINDLYEFDNFEGKFNEYSELDELVRGVLLAGLDQVLYQRNYDVKKGVLKKGTTTFIMEDGNRATVTPDSVNFKRKIWPSPFLIYVRRTHSEERRMSLIRETSIISPLTAFLFSQGRFTGYMKKTNITSNDDEDDKGVKDENEISLANSNDYEEVSLAMRGRKNIKLICSKETAEVLMKFRDIMWSVVRYMVANQGMVLDEDKFDYDQVEVYKEEILKVLGHMLSTASEHIDDPREKKLRYGSDYSVSSDDEK